MSHLIALDPSSTCTGWAEFRDGKCIDSGYIQTDGDDWVGELIAGLADMFGTRPPEQILVEDIANRGNNGRLFASSFQWAKSVGVAIAEARRIAPVVTYDSGWIRGKEYAKCKTAKQKNFRVECARAWRREASEVNEATAILFGQWWLSRSYNYSTGRAHWGEWQAAQGTPGRQTEASAKAAAAAEIVAVTARRQSRSIRKGPETNG